MYFILCLSLSLMVVRSFADVTDSAVAQAFMNDKIVSKIVFDPPTELIAVNYSGSAIYLGTTVQPLRTLTQPQVSYEANDEEFYTLLFFGPDLPPSIVPPLTQLLHWSVCNIPGQDISKGYQIATYFPPIPYPGGFPYIFLLFKQNGLLDTSTIPNLSFILSRLRFSYTKFTEKYNLGDPIAGNFMHEAYVQLLPDTLQTIYNIVGLLGNRSTSTS